MGRRLSGNIGSPINVDRINLRSRTSFGDAPATGRAAMELVSGRLHTRMPAEAAKGYAQVGEAQPIAKWLVADATALAALSVTSADVGYVARQASPLAFYRLTSTGPAVWELVGTAPTTDASQLTSGTLPAARLPAPTGLTLGGVMRNTGAAGEFVTGISATGELQRATPVAGGGSHTRGTWAARPGAPAVGDSYLATDLPQTMLRCWSAGTWTVYWRGVEVSPISSGWTQRNFAGAAALNALGPYTEFVGDSSNNNQITLALRSRTVASPWFFEVGLTSPLNYGVVAEVEGSVGYWAATAMQAGVGYTFQGWTSSFGFSGGLSSIGADLPLSFLRYESVSSSLIRILGSQDRVSWQVLSEQVSNAHLLDEAPTIGVSVRNVTGAVNRSVITHWLHGSL